jgi:hypothetical protein
MVSAGVVTKDTDSSPRAAQERQAKHAPAIPESPMRGVSNRSSMA